MWIVLTIFSKVFILLLFYYVFGGRGAAGFSVILKNATPLVENRVAQVLYLLKITPCIFPNIFFVQHTN